MLGRSDENILLLFSGAVADTVVVEALVVLIFVTDKHSDRFDIVDVAGNTILLAVAVAVLRSSFFFEVRKDIIVGCLSFVAVAIFVAAHNGKCTAAWARNVLLLTPPFFAWETE